MVIVEVSIIYSMRYYKPLPPFEGASKVRYCNNVLADSTAWLRVQTTI
jgi:hypothetical protein